MREIRLRVRNQNNDADLLTVSTSDFISAIPDGLGLEIDPLKGSLVTGQATIQIADAPNSTATAVTSVLADPNNRLALLGLQAYIEQRDSLGAWTTLTTGFVINAGLLNGSEYEIQIGDSHRAETILRLGVNPIIGSRFGNVKSMFPVGQSYLWIDSGVPAGLDLQSSVLPYVGTVKQIVGQRVGLEIGNAGPWVQKFIQDLFINTFLPYFEIIEHGIGIRDVTVLLRNVITNELQTAKLMLIWNNGDVSIDISGATLGEGGQVLSANGRIRIDFTGTPPALGTRWKTWAFVSTAINADNPLLVTGHPIDIIADAAIQLGEPFTVASVRSLREDFFPDLYFVLRYTASFTYQELERTIFSWLGINKRVNTAGQWELIEVRKPDNTAVPTIGINQLRSLDPTVWSANEDSIINTVQFSQEIFTRDASAGGDGLKTSKQTHIIEVVPEADRIQRNIEYSIPGQMYRWSAKDNKYVAVVGEPFFRFTEAHARDILRRYLAGGIITELSCTPDVTSLVGDEVIVNLPQLPNVPQNSRNGSRRMLILKRSETQVGPDLKLIDVASTTTLTTIPAFTLALTTNDSKHYYSGTITNAAALNALSNISVVLEAAIFSGVATPSVSQAAPSSIIWDAPNIPSTFQSARWPAGSTVWNRLRTVSNTLGPSDYSAWQSITLNNLNAPTNLSVMQFRYGTVIISWVPGEVDMATTLWAEITGDPATRIVVGSFPALSTTALYSPIIGSGYTYTVFHANSVETSPITTTTFTSTVIAPPPPPPIVYPPIIKPPIVIDPWRPVRL